MLTPCTCSKRDWRFEPALNGTQLGTDNYRGVHPRTLAMAEDFFASVLGERVRIDNPFMFTSKAEMCRALLEAGSR